MATQDLSVTDDLILAIDQGTSSGKVVLVNLAGRVVASAGGETIIRHPRPTWMESDAEEWWRTTAAGIRAVDVASLATLADLPALLERELPEDPTP